MDIQFENRLTENATTGQLQLECVDDNVCYIADPGTREQMDPRRAIRFWGTDRAIP